MAQITMTNSTSQVSRTLARRGPSGKSQAARNNVGAGRRALNFLTFLPNAAATSVGRGARHALDAVGVDTGLSNAKPLGDVLASRWNSL